MPSPAPAAHSPEIFLPIAVVTKRVAWQRSKIYAEMALERFPRPVKTSRKSVRWLQSEIESWMAERIRARDAEPTKH